jgi:hypothetical protein
VIVLTNLAEAQPESIAHSVAGLVEPSLRIPWPKDAGLRDDPRLKDRVLDVLGAWAAGKHSTAMGPGLRAVSTNTEREKAGRKRVVDLLSKRTAFNLLAEDDVGSRGLRRRGEAVSRIVHWGLVTPEKGYAVWFYMGADGIVVDFDLEPR